MDSFSGLLNNSALMLVLCITYDTFNIHAIEHKQLKEVLTGVIVGLIAIAVMMSPWRLVPGVFFDTRWVLLSLCGLFFGFTPTSIAVLMAGGFRLYQGGAGGVVGTLVIVTTAATGLGWRYLKDDRPLSWQQLYLFGVLVQVVMLSCMALMPEGMRWQIIETVAPPVLSLYPMLTLVIGLVLMRQEARRETDRALIREVRERKTAENAARESETRLRTLVETMPDLVWLKDPDGVFLGCNRKFEDLFGIPEAELKGKTDYDIVDQKRADRFRKNDLDAMAAGQPLRNECQLVYSTDGRKEVVETIKTPMYDHEGALLGVLGVGRDITDRKKTELALELSREEWKKTFDAISDIVSLHDPDLRIVRINRAGCRAVGMEKEQIIGRYCNEVYQDEPGACKACPLTVTLETGRPHTSEVTNPKLNKTFVVSASPVFDSQGRLTHLTHVAKDVTELKKLEKELFRVQKMESIGTLAGGIAHDFNNILYAVMGFAELAKEKLCQGEDAQEDLDQILLSSRRAAELVQHILTFSRKSNHRLEAFSPLPVVREALQMLRASMPSSILILENLDEDCPKIMADPTSIHQIVVNLCTNALHAMEDQKGMLSIRLGQEEITGAEAELAPGRFVVLEISDTGVGMDADTLEQIFDPFFTTKEVGRGTGLGLSVIHGIIQDYKGVIRVTSRPGKGAVFRVFIPALEAAREETAAHGEGREAVSTGKEHLLLVDDETMIVELNRKVLRQMGYEVTAMTDSRKALEAVRKAPEKFDLVITDQTMPEMTGMELAREILDIRPGMPIIICTGYSAVMSRDDALKAGLQGYIEKPVDRETLGRTIREVLDCRDKKHDPAGIGYAASNPAAAGQGAVR